jgi:hypothetical protein
MVELATVAISLPLSQSSDYGRAEEVVFGRLLTTRPSSSGRETHAVRGILLEDECSVKAIVDLLGIPTQRTCARLSFLYIRTGS